MKPSKRLNLIPPYLFAELERKISEKKAAGIDVISLGIGDPDTPTYPEIVRAGQQAMADPQTAAILASSVFVQSAAQPDAAERVAPPMRDRVAPRPVADSPAHRIVARDLREMQAYEYRPPEDFRAPTDGFFIRGKRLAFARRF